MKKNIRILAAALGIAAVVSAGCGSQNTSAAQSSAADSTAAAASSSAASAATAAAAEETAAATEETTAAEQADTESSSQDKADDGIEYADNAKADAAKVYTGDPVQVTIATTTDENRIWDALNAELKDRGDNITVSFLSMDGTLANRAVAEGEVDLNSFQHYAYFTSVIRDQNLDLVSIGDTLIVPLNLFSKKVSSVDEIPEGGSIAIPDDATNQGRALNVLKNAGLISLDPNVGNNGKLTDITSNPKNLSFVEMSGAELPRSLDDVDAAIINCGYAVDAGLDPNNDPIYKDKIDLNNPEQKPFINMIGARRADADNQVYLRVVAAYHSKRVADAIAEVYQNAAIPAFDYSE